jgi:serine/threonine-protein kinase
MCLGAQIPLTENQSMPDSDPKITPERFDASADRSPTPSDRRGSSFHDQDPPTVRSGSAGSSVRRNEPLVPSSALARALPEAGDRIDSFELEQPIGVGGMGAVFRALDTSLDRHVALKILPPEQANDSEVVQRFYQEGRAAARLDHENIARVYTIGNDGRYHYIAFEFIDGITVRQRVEKTGPLSISEAVNFTLQIADALVHASERGVVHRDIKPSNIVVTHHDRAKLVDMGLARRFERGGDDGLTQSGMTLGTFDYISPEQARDPRDVDVRSDLYSLGCTLFHMLTGRPPFPDGTVLQKLIQHQEEPPPDIRALNPAVTPDLAAVIVKLMAKDRDRRYQTPEQLVRDLLTVAGTLGLRSVSPEGLVWMSAKPPAAWERHLVWGVPAIAFAAIVLALVWWTQDPRMPPIRPSDLEPTVTVSPPRSPVTRPSPRNDERTASVPPRVVPSVSNNGFPSGKAFPVSATPRVIEVGSDEDLAATIAQAPPGSTIVLADDGPYLLGNENRARPADATLSRGDLSIKAGDGVRPVLKLAAGTALAASERDGLLEFVGGRVTVEGLEFVLEPGVGSIAAISAANTEMTIRRCLFRRSTQSGSDNGLAAIRLSVSGGGEERPPAVLLDRCHLDGGQTGLHCTGPVGVTLRDCTLGSGDPAIWLVGGETGTAGANRQAELRLRHVSMLAGDRPVFRVEGIDPRIWVDDSVIADASDGEATLLATDRPDNLVWRGRSNLYSGIGLFLLPIDSLLGREPIRDPARWSETADEIRELGSTFTQTRIWEEPNPSRSLAQESQDPTWAFRISSAWATTSQAGVRSGPFVTLPTAERKEIARETPTDRRPPAPPSTLVARSESANANPDVPPTATTTTTGSTPPESTQARVGTMPEMPEMPVATASKDRSSVPNETGDVRNSENGTDGNAPPPSSPPTRTAGSPATSRNETRPEPATIRTVEQFVSALSDPNARGGLLRVAADADWELPAIALRATGSWRVQAEPGPTRPRLRFVPSRVETKPVSSWLPMLDLRAGSLQLEGFDVVIPRPSGALKGHPTAFLVRPATDLSLSACTVTIEGEQAGASVVVSLPGEEGAGGEANGSPATVRIGDSLLRAGGDLVNVEGGQKVVIELNNTLVSIQGTLLHGHGSPRDETPETIGLTLRQVTARTSSGLVRLESTPDAPELPVADVNIRDSILITTSDPQGPPLLRVEGQEGPASTRDRILWEGHGVAYHQIGTYRRDQSSQVGSMPVLYDRRDWTVAVGARESTPVHGDVKFLHPWDPERPSWRLRPDDARLAPDSPALSCGPDLDRIPSPPVDVF